MFKYQWQERAAPSGNISTIDQSELDKNRVDRIESYSRHSDRADHPTNRSCQSEK